jgi:hypothetical protein
VIDSIECHFTVSQEIETSFDFGFSFEGLARGGDGWVFMLFDPFCLLLCADGA